MKSSTQNSEKSSRISRDEMLMRITGVAAMRSTCLRKRIGAIAEIDGRPVALGYGGSPQGTPHCTEIGCLLDPETGGCIRTQHAEANVIAFAARHGIALEGATLWTTVAPCLPCAKMIMNAGFKRVVFYEAYRDGRGSDLIRIHSNIAVVEYLPRIPELEALNAPGP